MRLQLIAIFFAVFFVSELPQTAAQCVQGDCRNGYGVYYWAKSRMKYTGFFQNGRPHGDGMAIWTEDGGKERTYDGSWKNGFMHGEGTMVLTDNSKLSGKWENSEFKGELQETTLPEAKIEPAQPAPARSAEVSKAAQEQRPQVWALAVGVANYDPLVMQPLTFTARDAERIYDFWRSPNGGALDPVHTKILTNTEATYANVKKAMKELFAKAGPKDMIIFYFSGHGLEGSFLPVDYDGTNNEFAHTEIGEIMQSSKAAYKVCIADACHSGGMWASKGSASDMITIDNFYNALKQSNPGTAFLMSSRKNEQSLESRGLRGGLFSYYVLKGLGGAADMDNNAIITITELYGFVSSKVSEHLKNTHLKQTPLLLGEYDERMPLSVLR